MSEAGGDVMALVAAARQSGQLETVVQAIPFCRFLGLTLERHEAMLCARLAHAPRIVGNALIPALHGGAVASLLESIAFFELAFADGSVRAPRIVSITVDYLRTARAVDTLARAEVTRHGRRIATVHARAWQDDPARPVASARLHFLLTPT